MSKSNLSLSTKLILWGKSAGRCQYEGCNKSLFLDVLTNGEFNQSYIAHIVADEVGGPRGDEILSPKLAKDIGNLMLLCDSHHRLIDRIDVSGHQVERLREMKAKHEERIEILTAISLEKQSHILLYGARIGEHESSLSYHESAIAMTPERYPCSNRPICLGMTNSLLKDTDPLYWQIQLSQLTAMFDRDVMSLRSTHPVQHFSVFALAPIPMLIKLGTLLGEIFAADVYQRRRNPEATWRWLKRVSKHSFQILTPSTYDYPPVLNLSISGNIANERIYKVLGPNISIWTVTSDFVDLDCMESKSQLEKFKQIIRNLLNNIKMKHGQNAVLSIFPAMPISCSVEFGRAWMPKSDLAMVIYDQNRTDNTFIKTITIP